ncbi:MAG: hypothetical protein KKG99_00670 [Bacteroidetes bacterium]|nr:hypothetical protein [Bacteroidota bacterium]
MTKCPNCKSELKVIDKIYAEYIFCQNCDFEKLEYNSSGCCMFPKVIPVRYYSDEIEAMRNSDNYTIYGQCQNCGKRVGHAMKKIDFDKNKLPHSNDEIIENAKKVRDELSEIAEKIHERKKNKNQDDYWNDYSEYLKSEKWLKIREIVLKRDNNLCQSCLCEEAIIVHHTIGHFRKNEPLFTLVSLCGRCHDIITEIERGNHKDAQKIEYEFKNK